VADGHPEVATKAPERTFEHMFLELAHRLAAPGYPEKYLLMYPDGSGWTASLEGDPDGHELLDGGRRPLIEWAHDETARTALQRLLEVRDAT